MKDKIVVRSLINKINSLNISGGRFFCTSTTIRRGIRIIWSGYLFWRTLINFSLADFLNNPKEKIYSLLSRTSSNFFLPQFSSGFTKFFDYLFLGHFFKFRWHLSDKFSNFIKMFFCFFNFMKKKIKFFDANCWLDAPISESLIKIPEYESTTFNG